MMRSLRVRKNIWMAGIHDRLAVAADGCQAYFSENTVASRQSQRQRFSMKTCLRAVLRHKAALSRRMPQGSFGKLPKYSLLKPGAVKIKNSREYACRIWKYGKSDRNEHSKRILQMKTKIFDVKDLNKHNLEQSAVYDDAEANEKVEEALKKIDQAAQIIVDG